MTRYWLLKTEPNVFSFADLLAAPDRTTLWEGVRNFQARNFLREMRRGERVLIYHSSTQPADVAGVATVTGEAAPDPTQFKPHGPYFDAGRAALGRGHGHGSRSPTPLRTLGKIASATRPAKYEAAPAGQPPEHNARDSG